MNRDTEIDLKSLLDAELDANRRSEFGLIPKALLAVLVVGVLVAIRVVFFS